MSRDSQHDPFEIANSEYESAYKEGFRTAIDGELTGTTKRSTAWLDGYKDGSEWAMKNQRFKDADL